MIVEEMKMDACDKPLKDEEGKNEKEGEIADYRNDC